MRNYHVLIVVFFSWILEAWGEGPVEPQCHSRFDYEYKVLQRLVQLEEGQKRIEERLQVREDDDLKGRIAQLETNQVELNTTLTDMIVGGSTKSKTASVQLEEGQKRIEERLQVREDDDLNGRIAQLETNQVELNTTLTDMIVGGSTKSKTASGSFVGFSAYIDTATSLAEFTVFSKVLVNAGSIENEKPPYDESSGVFTCPVTGYYLISVVIAVRGSGECYAIVKHNGNVLIHAVVEGGSKSSQDLQGGNLAVVKLTKGDRVWVSRKLCW